jgi:hypothetical protein
MQNFMIFLKKFSIFHEFFKIFVVKYFLIGFKVKICQKFKINQAKVTKWVAINHFCLVNFIFDSF